MKQNATTLSSFPSVPVAPVSLRVLCAEDHPQMADVLLHFLRRAGHRPEMVGDGQQALERLTAGPNAYDLLITDHMMPCLSGLGLVSKLRDIPFGGPIIVFSSMLSEAERDAYRALAVDHILTKPTHMDTLLRALYDIGARGLARSG